MTLEIPSLGRPFTLGMLYDAREEKIIPGISLWNKEDLVNNLSTQSQNNTDFEVLTSDSFCDKLSAMDISGALKISVWSGMVNINGSGKYLNDTKESKKQARVTLKYKRTTKFDQLSMNHLSYNNITYQEVFNKGKATHVVTGILYGAQAFFIFDQKVTNSEKVRDVEGKIAGMVKKIGELSGNVKMDDTEKEDVSQFSCKFQGDFALERNPTTYEEVVKIYASLPNLIGENGEKAVPIKVWLYPLEDLDSRAARLVREISDRLVFTAEEIMQEMSEVIMECNDMMGHPAAITFPALANKIRQFKKLFESFRIMFQKKLSQVLPSVRGGNMGESSLEEILTGKERSPFSDQKIRTFLDRRWREMDYVYSVLKQLEKLETLRIVTEKRELIEEILDPKYAFTDCFNFSLEYKDLYLSHLQSWLYKEPWDYNEIFSDGENEEWYEEMGSSWNTRDLVNKFKSNEKNTYIKYLVTSVVCSKGPGIDFHPYCNGYPVNDFCTHREPRTSVRMALEIPSLGRPFTIGMLYDAREEKIIPGISLWNKKDLVNNISTRPLNNTEFEVLTSDSFDDKSSAMDISGALKISVWSGMVNINGSGKYLNDTKESKNQARVTLKYKRTTKFDQLSMDHLCHKNTYKEVFNKGTATHVVTGILYGAQAFFIFDQKVTNSEEVRDVEGKIAGMVMKIGELSGDMKMNDTEREVVRHFSCKFQGDFALKRNPTTYEEVVKIYASLPNLIGENGEKAVPIKVWLYPLKDLDSRAPRLVREISDHLVFTAEEIMEQMSEVIMECNDMMGHPAAITFLPLANKIRQFKKLFESFRIMFQKKLSQVLPSVRGGNMEESSLEEILTGKERSPFSDQKIRTFLDRRLTEMDYVQLLLKQLKKFLIVTEKGKLIEEIHDSGYYCTQCFNFSLEYEDLYLSHLESWLNREPWDYNEIFSDGETEEWYEEEEISENTRVHVNVFTAIGKLTKIKRLVTSVVCSKGPGISVHHYCNREHVTAYCTHSE